MQALWKGYSLRRKSKSKRLTLVRQRVEEANAAATEEKKLGNRTSSALDYLLKYKHLSPVLDALKHLGRSLVAFNMLNLREMDTFSGEATLFASLWKQKGKNLPPFGANSLYPSKLCVGGILFSRPSICPSIMFWSLQGVSNYCLLACSF